ncbi:MAG: dephospho-CoA kinase, partial [Clostridia bacterium]|nr:dephospho-CoA kinase [Clostridia bacterium]
SLNRSELARVVFASPERVALLDSITHPAISKRLLELVVEAEESGKYPLIFVDAALLIESGFYKFCDKIWLVTSNTGMRVRRIVLRDGIDHKAALKRISSQMPDEQKLPYASLVIENNGTIDDLIASVDKAFNDELSLNGFAQSSIS